MEKQRRKKRGGFLDINRFRTKFLNRGKDRMVPKNTKYAISKLREALRIYGLRVSSTLQEERGD